MKGREERGGGRKDIRTNIVCKQGRKESKGRNRGREKKKKKK